MPDAFIPAVLNPDREGTLTGLLGRLIGNPSQEERRRAALNAFAQALVGQQAASAPAPAPAPAGAPSTQVAATASPTGPGPQGTARPTAATKQRGGVALKSKTAPTGRGFNAAQALRNVNPEVLASLIAAGDLNPKTLLALLQGPAAKVHEIDNQLVRVDPNTGVATSIFSAPVPVTPQTAIGKARQDMKSGAITRDEFASVRRELLRPGRELRSTLGGAVIDVNADELVAPGTLNVIEVASGNERTVAIRSTADLEVLLNQMEAGQIVETSKSGRQGGKPPFGLQKPEIKELRSQETNVRDFLQRSETLIDLMADNPQALSVTGRAAQMANSIAAQIVGAKNIITSIGGQEATPEEAQKQAAANVGPDFFDNIALRLGRVTGTAVDASRIQGFVVSLAFAAAAAEGQLGRAISDKDIEKFIRRIGQSPDPAVFTTVLRDVQRELVGGLRNRIVTFNRTAPDEQRISFPAEFESILARPAVPSQGKEPAAAASGSTRFRVENGKLVPVQ